MAKSKQTEVNEESLTHTALGVYKNPKTGEWMVARIMYDPKTGETSTVKEELADLKMYAMEKYKIYTSKEIFSRED